MLWRISAALFALYLVHGAENVSHDGAKIAAEVRKDAPQALVSLCIENPGICQKALKQVSNVTVPESTPAPRQIVAPALAGASAVPVATGIFPLPPVRPAGLPVGKGA